MPTDERHTIAYQEALRAVSDQQTALYALHGRASTLASAAAVVTGLVGLAQSDSRALGLPGLIAVLCLAGILVLVGLIIWPRRGQWRFHFQASRLYWSYIEGPRPLSSSQMQRDLALHLEAYFRANARQLDRFGNMLGVAILLLFIEVAAVMLELWKD